MSAFSITNERMKAVNFVDYFKAGTIWAVQKGNPNKVSLDELCGLKVGVQTGSVQEDPDLTGRSKACTDAGKPAIDVISLANQTDITTRLVNGGIAAMVSGGTTITYALTQTGGQLELLGEMYNPDHNGIAVAKDDIELADLVAKVMNKLIADGSYAARSWTTGASPSSPRMSQWSTRRLTGDRHQNPHPRAHPTAMPRRTTLS